MESWVLGIFQEQLSKFIVGFRRDNVNANLLNGKGEIKDISLNCTEINSLLTDVTPYIEFESVHVSKLSFHVSSYTNIKHAPILIDIGDIQATIVEPLDFAGATTTTTKIQQITREKLEQLIASGKQKLRGRYSIFDRILDNLSVEVNSVNLSFLPRGKFKTKRLGPWTPPKIVVTLRNVRYVSVDEYGLEASPDDVWRHNKHHHSDPMWKWTVLIFKKLSMECTFSLLPTDGSPVPPPILKDGSIEVQVSYRRRYRDAAILGIQVDTTLAKLELELAASTVTLLAHLVAGLKYCLSKDRAFEDPLLPYSQTAAANHEIEVSLTQSHDGEATPEHAAIELDDSVLDSMEELSSSSSSDQEDASLSDQEEETSKANAETEQSATAPAVTANPEQPVLLLPNGIVIHEQVSFSLTVLDLSFRGNYLPRDDGYFQMTMKGLVTEMIWPKVGGGKGMHLQNSFSYICVKDCHGPKSRSILIGGVHNDNTNPVELPSGPTSLDRMGIDSFPLFEDRSIRDNPLGIKPSFPSQALGLKVTVDCIDKAPATEKDEREEDIMVLCEIGVDHFDFVLDSEAWCRIIRFGTNDGKGFDDRWHSGNWGDEISSDMLVDSTMPLAFKDHTQPCKEFFFNDDFLISSNLFNATARITNVAAHIPAAVNRDIRTCDVVVSLDESMLLISSALPRTFLNGKIGSTSGGGEILFPNDRSDICYELERTEDPSLRQAGEMTTRNVPTFRVQTTMKGCSVKLVPVVRICKFTKLEHLVEPTNITLIACFEEIAEVSRKKNRVKLALFVSILLQKVELNLDVGLLTGALNTVLHHIEVATDTIDTLQSGGIVQKTSVTKEKHERTIDSIGEDGLYVESLIQGLRVMMKRQISRSRKTGGFYVSLGLETGDVRLNLWRQNIPIDNRWRLSDEPEKSDTDFTMNVIPVVKLMEFHGKGVEIGVEGSIFSEVRRNVVKICLSDMAVGLCDFEGQWKSHHRQNVGNKSEEGENMILDLPMATLLRLNDDSVHESIRNAEDKTEGYNGVLLRFEEEAGASRSISFGCDVAVCGAVTLANKEIETFLILIADALLAPLQSKKNHSPSEPLDSEINTIFPPGSVGNFLESQIPISLRSIQLDVNLSEFPADTSITQRIHEVIKNLLPDDVAKVAIGVSFGELLLFIPDKQIKCTESSVTDSLCLHLYGSSLALAFLETGECWNREKDVLRMPVSLDKTWEDIFSSRSQGYYLNLSSTQGLHTSLLENGSGTVKTRLVPMFGARCSCNPLTFSTSMDEVSLSVSESDKFLSAYHLFVSFCDSLVESTLRISEKISSLNGRKSRTPTQAGTTSIWGLKNSSKALDLFNMAHHDLTSTISTSRLLLDQLKQIVATSDYEMKSKLVASEEEVKRLKKLVFSKEKDRLAALALVAPQATGWLRMGGTHQSGQRVASSTATVWRYWGVLRRSLLILFTAPGDEAVFFISLQGAQLYPLLSERTKRGVKRGFALVESTGVTHYFVAGSGSEYDMWTRQMHRAIKSHSPAVDEEKPIESGPTAGVGRVSDSNDDNGREAHNKQKGFPAKELEYSHQITHHNHEDVDSKISPNKRVNIREKLAAVKSGTSNRLGSAVQNAKHNVKAAQERRRLRTYSDDSFDSEIAGDTNAMSEVSGDFKDKEVNKDEGIIGEPARNIKNSGVRNRFSAARSGTKNRLGLAMQKAKQNVLTANEKRRQQMLSDDMSSTSGFDESLHGKQANLDRPIENIDLNNEVPDDLDGLHTGEGHAVEPDDGQDLVQDLASCDHDYEQDDVAARRPKIGNRVAKIGAAVKSARLQSNRSIRSPGDDEAKGRFSLRRFNKTQNSNTFSADSADPIKIRLATIGPDPLDVIDHSPVSLSKPLKDTHEHCIIHVEALELEETDSIPDASKLQRANIDEKLHQSTKDASSSEEIQKIIEEKSSELSMPSSSSLSVREASSRNACHPESKANPNFRIIVLDKNYYEADKDKVMDGVVRSLSDVLSLYTLVSESLNEIPLDVQMSESGPSRNEESEMNSNLASKLGLSPLDSILLAGKLLGNLLELDADIQKGDALISYQRKILGDFLNTIVNCPLPKSVHEGIENFLGLKNLAKETPLGHDDDEIKLSEESLPSLRSSDPKPTSTNSVLSLASACDSELSKAENYGVLAKMIASSGFHEETEQSENPITGNDETFRPPNHRILSAAIEDQIIEVMTERDEIQKRMCASRVLHMRELEDERMKAHQLVKTMDKTEGDTGSAIQHANRSFDAVQSTDAELLSLCQQLASEISEKTSLALEKIRLKELLEAHEIRERSENEILLGELRSYKEIAEKEKKSTEKATQEAERWKQMYENLLQEKTEKNA